MHKAVTIRHDARARLLILAAGVLLLVGTQTLAARVVLRIQAGNKRTDISQKVEIKSNLPPRVGTDDILELDGLELKYDVKNDLYFVHSQLDLVPGEIRIFNVEINDIWSIPDGELDMVRKRAKDLVDMLRESDYHETATGLLEEIDRNLDLVAEFQAANAIDRVPTPQHIRAFDANERVFKHVKRTIGRIENLVLGTGQDPGKLMGEIHRVTNPKGEVELPPEQYNTAIIRISVQNTSKTRQRNVPLKRNLPAEIKAEDVLDSAGLAVGTDFESGIIYVSKDLVLEPDQTVAFDVKIRDKWNVNQPRTAATRAKAEELLVRIKVKPHYESIETDLTDLVAQLDALAQEKGPTELNGAYIAFFRDQQKRLDDIEQKIYRIESATRPIEKTTKLGFPVKAPSMKTTWMIIYIILGFLALVSLLFFFRWYGRSKAEALSMGEAGGPHAAGETDEESAES